MENVKNKMMDIIKKQEYDYNHQTPLSPTDIGRYYHDNVVVFANDEHRTLTSTQDKKRAIDMHKKYLVNTSTRSMKTTVQSCHVIDHLVTCQYTIAYYEPMKKEVYQLLQKLSFKTINIDALIDDLYQNGFNVNQLLVDLLKYNKTQPVPDSFTKLDVANLLVIMYRHNVTAKMILENPYVHDLIKDSPGAAIIFNFQNMKPQATGLGNTKVSDRRLIKTLHVYAVFYYHKHKDELTIINMHWC